MAMTLITTNSETNATSSSFTSGIDSTYKLFIFKWFDVNPADEAGNVQFYFNGSTDGGSNYNVTKTTTDFHAFHYENDSSTDLAYNATFDIAQGTGYQAIAQEIGDGGDESTAGTLWLFNPSNTTYVKHFYSQCVSYALGDRPFCSFVSGYFNTTSAINAVDFKISEPSPTSETFDGIVKMYGVG